MKSQPFFFDANIFDDVSPLTEEEKAALPEFTRDEMEDAKTAAFEKGKKSGFTESQEGITSSILKIIRKIEHDISILFTSEEERKATYEEEAIMLASVLFTKALPDFMEAHGKDELKTAISSTLKNYIVPPQIDIELNETMLKELSTFIEKQASSLQKSINLKADNSLSPHTCKICWSGGGVVCNRNEINQKILDILNQSLAERSISLHDEVENLEYKTNDSNISNNETGAQASTNQKAE